MRLEIGNKVAVLDDVLKGIVTSIHDDEVSIQTSDGMIFKFKSKELVKIFPVIELVSLNNLP